MLDLYDEFKALISALTIRKVDYALCGGLAMAVHGIQRATVDIDLLILAADLSEAKDVARGLGFTAEALPMTFSGSLVLLRADQARRRRSRPTRLGRLYTKRPLADPATAGLALAA